MTESPDDRPEGERPSTDRFATGGRVPEDAEWELVAQAAFDRSKSDGLTTTVVFAVADAEGVSPGDVKSPPLYEVVDTAALEAAFSGGGAGPDFEGRHCSTEFMYRGHRVVVRSDGWVQVHDHLDG